VAVGVITKILAEFVHAVLASLMQTCLDLNPLFTNITKNSFLCGSEPLWITTKTPRELRYGNC
jgi:hypothetical protein